MHFRGWEINLLNIQGPTISLTLLRVWWSGVCWDILSFQNTGQITSCLSYYKEGSSVQKAIWDLEATHPTCRGADFPPVPDDIEDYQP